MASTEYSKIYSHEKRLSYVFSYVLPIIIIILLVLVYSVIHDSNLKTPIMASVPFVYIIIFEVVYRRSSFRSGSKSTESYFKKIGNEKLAMRYVILRKIHRTRCVEYLIYALVFASFMGYILSIQNQNNPAVKDLENFLFSITFVPIIMILAFSFYFSSLNIYNDFHFYFARSCSTILKNFNTLDDLNKSSWLWNCLYAYNKYLRINQNFKLNDIETVYSKIISGSVDLMNQRLDVIFDKLTKGKKLDLLRYILELTEGSGTKPIIFSQGTTTRIKELVPIVIPILSLAIAMVELFKR